MDPSNAMTADELVRIAQSQPEIIYQRGPGARTLLHTAVVRGDEEMLTWFCDKHKVLLDLQDAKGNTALHLVSETLFPADGKDGRLALQMAKRL